MKIVGIVAEYNPFHKGHEYQLKMAKELSGCDCVAAVMSGNFVQRGEPAIIDKYKRAEAAIYGGADLIIELPIPYCCQNAEVFARAAITELKKLNITHLSFGCENSDLKLLKEIALLQVYDKSCGNFIKEEIKKGISYPAALSNALNKISPDSDFSNIIKAPNNVLAIEYIKSSIILDCSWSFVPVKRIGKNHNDENISGHFDSASAIRKGILTDFKSFNSGSLTNKSMDMINRFYDEYHSFNCLNSFLYYIYYQILSIGTDGLNNIYDISEGLNNKIYSNIFRFNNIDEYIMSLKSKRYTYSRIRRILLNILLGINNENIRKYMLTNKIYSDNNYIKVLAFNDKGRQILRKAKSEGTAVINSYSDYKKNCIDMSTFKLTDKTTNIYYLPFSNRKINEEFYNNAVYVQD